MCACHFVARMRKFVSVRLVCRLVPAIHGHFCPSLYSAFHERLKQFLLIFLNYIQSKIHQHMFFLEIFIEWLYLSYVFNFIL